MLLNVVPEARVLKGNEAEEEEFLVESVGNLTSMLEYVQNLNLACDWVIS